MLADHDISCFVFPSDTHTKSSTATETVKHSQEHFKFTLPKIQPSLPIQHQNNISKSLPTWILTTDFNFLLLLYLPKVLHLEDLEPNIKTMWYPFILYKGKPSNNCTLYIFTQEAIFLFYDETGQTNNPTGKYIIELSKLKHLQRYMTTF